MNISVYQNEYGGSQKNENKSRSDNEMELERKWLC